MSRRSLRRLTLAGCAFLCVAGLLVTVGWFRVTGMASPPDGSIRIAGLDRQVTVHVDTFGIPWVRADGEADMLRALGYLHASDRLWQMELFRRIAAGRLSEVFGSDLVPTDRLLRTLGLREAAERAVAALGEEDAARLRAYAEGVNARIRSGGESRPLEFAILRIAPEPWDPVSSLAVAMVMSLDLSHWRRDLSRYWASRHMSADRAASLSLGYPEWGATILDSPLPLHPGPGSAAGVASPGVGPPGSSSTDGPTAWQALDVLETVSLRVASNAWVVSGDRSASGHPILANDMHLALRAPAIWYLAALHADSAGYHAVGFTLPGIPGVLVGHNRHVAWGFTNGMVDDMDFAVETSSADGRRYRDGDGWLEYEVRPETLTVRGAAPEVFEVRRTRRGPVVSDALPGLDADLSAVWVAAMAEMSLGGLWSMNRAPDATALDEAIRDFVQPHQNVVYASTGGRIGYRLGGRIPLRDGWDGAVPVPAEVMGGGFRGFWPPAAHPAGTDPVAGFYATANNLQAPGLGTAISTDYAAPFRAQRISERLASRSDWTPESMSELQRDTHSLLADRTIDLAIRAAERAGNESALRRLRDWDRSVAVDSRGAPLFYSWLYRLRALIAADEYAAAPGWAFFPTKTLLAVLEEGEASAWVDDVRTPAVETLDRLAERALEDADRAVGDATWGELHREVHRHPLGRNDWLDRLFAFDVGPYPAPGGPNTVRPDDYRKWSALDSTSWSPPWTAEYGPSERFVVVLDPAGPQGWFLVPTGQSGNPFSRHYRDMNDRWRSGPLLRVPLDWPEGVRRPARRISFLRD